MKRTPLLCERMGLPVRKTRRVGKTRFDPCVSTTYIQPAEIIDYTWDSGRQKEKQA